MKTMSASGKWISIWICLLLISPMTAFGSDDIDNKVREISNLLRCPTCQAQSVKDSDAGLSVNMKQKIRELLEEGKTEDEILDYFVARYGEWILRSPRKKGVALMLWILPGVVLILATTALIRHMKTKSSKSERKNLKPLSAEEQKNIDNELKNI